MKRILSYWRLLFAIFIAVGLMACQNEDDPFSKCAGFGNVLPKQAGNRISEDEALSIAEKVLKKTRSTYSFAEVKCVMSNKNTRSGIDHDTIAYVINYPNDGGFVIVAGSRQVKPLLGYSYTGNFTFDNEIAKENFIDRIDSYIDTADPNGEYIFDDQMMDGCVAKIPQIQFSLHQWDPWDKYVKVEHPGCPVGCVAVATTLVMVHSKEELNYHGSKFEFSKILKGLKGENNFISPLKFSPDPTPVELPYSYGRAVDSIAKLIYWIGKDVDMYYDSGSSSAPSSKAYALCKNLDFSVLSSMERFNIDEIIDYMDAGCIIYMRGSGPSTGGHAWVADGYNYCKNIDNPGEKLDAFIYCDWGWGGKCNGYYAGPVFSLSVGNVYDSMQYFAVRKEVESSLTPTPAS